MKRLRKLFILLACISCSSSITPIDPNTWPTTTTTPPKSKPPVVTAPTTTPEEEPVTTLPTIIGGRGGYGNMLTGASVRIALSTSAKTASFSTTPAGSWNVLDRTGNSIIKRLNAGEVWTASSLSQSVILRSSSPDILLSFNGKRYRGDIVLISTDSGMLVINTLPMEAYLRGVVPLEIGNRNASESAAVQAQAVAARSYGYLHLTDRRAYDMLATVQDQVYGGADAERPFSDAAVAATAGMVLMYNGRIVNTPYHSTCGGTTAGVSEVWQRQPDEAYLKPVDDTDPNTGQSYCAVSPRYSWTREYSSSQLVNVLNKYLKSYTPVEGTIASVRSIKVAGRTESGRVSALSITTGKRSSYTLRGNDIRFVFRAENGEILNSTNFTVDTDERNGKVTHLTIHGKGYGHGIGMCQWGAIARARAGQDFKTILRTYYPGTTVGRVQ